jgi:threonine dehydrogenase-like Zn-dependent dehydrogenase
MTALEWHGNKDIRVATRGKPVVTEPADAIVRITSTSVCGSDLHLYHKEFPGLYAGDVLGHECMGVVDDVGPECKNFKKGDRVVVSAVIICGQCDNCKKGKVSLCHHTNPNPGLDEMYGDRLSGIFGYSHLLGGFDGGQAEYIRVPLGDNNLLKVADNLPDEKVLFLSDIACTGWHANELGEVGNGDVVCVWGLGPVGQMACMWAKFRGASRVIGIDCIPDRLRLAEQKLGIETINFSERDTITAVRQMIPGGPDVVIEAVGFRFPKSLTHAVLKGLKLETDVPDVLTECIKCVKLGGRVSIVGDYLGTTDNFPIGALMEKGLTFRGSQVYVQKYWKELLGYIESGKVDPSFVVSTHMPLEKGDEAYKLFDNHQTMKIVLKTPFGMQASGTKSK